MKNLMMIVLLLHTFHTFSQQKPTDLDKSPADISYCPPNYPILKMQGAAKDAPVARVIYSRPQKAGRTIFGGIVAYNQIWRLGANEATEIEFFRNVKVSGNSLAKGRYTMYAICNEDKWTIIFNNEKDIWGLSYNQKKDALRTDVPVTKTDDIIEALTMYFDGSDKSYNLNIMWDNVKVILPISFK
ncbi:MAG: DUF2911 domain-containing protein [Parafilimonas sp.]